MQILAERSKMWRRLRVVAIGLVATVAGLVALASPAAAHYAPIWHGNDLGQVTSTHTRVSIYDGECDGVNAVIQYQVTGDSAVWQTMDLNGCTTGGSGFTLPSGRFVTRARVCEGTNCTGWQNH